jgi:MGT family glycosyltransferase
MTTLGHELKQRGHRVTVFGPLDAQVPVLAAGLSFWVLGESEYPKGSIPKRFARLGEMNGLSALQYNIKEFSLLADMSLRNAPEAIRKAGTETLIIDQITLEGESLAEYLGIPFISVCSALLLNREDGVPPHFTPWSYNPAWWARVRNRVGYSLLYRMVQPIREVVGEYRQRWKLPRYSYSSEPYSKLAQLSQQPAEFEFPRQHLPECFHFTGPYSNPASREPIAFPFDNLTGQPLVYASLGTVVNRLTWIFHNIAEACAGMNAQLVISLGGSGSPESFSQLPGNPLVVKYAPQLELLQRASLTITHAGLNTTLESLSNGVPMVAIPIANDQPAVAARIAWTGSGEVVPLSRLSVPRLRAAIQRVLTEESYKKNALRLQEAIRRSGGVSRAADIVEQVVSTGKRVYR